ncbi:solute carrier family 17 [Nesidiocoris tenuis]|uniref:Solute carrier family 17 n=1 Tax=Nesidiocoris tenuis TaxID=355587 RepID=A0ABN7BCI4_9HEMI|nr:solute carrier family 17 [Nesidiocoris tenuis]
MVRSIWLFGLRTRHLIALVLSSSYSVDALMHYTSIDDGRTDRYFDGDEFSRRARELDNEQYRQLTNFSFLSCGIARFLASFVILRINNKYLLLGSTVAEVALCCASSSIYGSYGAEGLNYLYLSLIFVQQFRFPLALNILSKWSSPYQMTFCFGLFQASRLFLRTIAIKIIDSLLARGYSSVFSGIYLGCGVKCLFFVLWFLLGAADPYASLIASESEKEEIRKFYPRRLKVELSSCPPWKQILKMPELYAFVVGEIGNYWCYRYESSRFMDPVIIPKYRDSVTVLAAYYLYLVVALINAAVVDFLIKIEFSSVNNIRKTASTVTAWGCAVCLLMYGYNCDSMWEDVWLGVFLVFKIANFLNQQTLNVHSVSPTYCGFIYSIISSLAFFSMIGLPHIEKFFLSRKQKQNLMYLIGFLLFFTNMLMTMIGDLDVKDFDTYGTVKWKDESLLSYP